MKTRTNRLNKNNSKKKNKYNKYETKTQSHSFYESYRDWGSSMSMSEMQDLF